MTLLSTQNDSKRAPQLTRDDWISAALDALIADGVAGVQITALSKILGVTRGSFYWHFENREELLTALLAEWRAKNSDIMVEALTEPNTLQEGILALLGVWVDHEKFDPSLDQSVRDWSRRSVEVRVAVEKEDDNRIAAIADFYERFGYEPTEAFIRARVIYLTQFGYHTLNIDEPMAKRVSYLAAYYQCFTGDEIDEDAALEFVSEILDRERTSDGGDIFPTDKT